MQCLWTKCLSDFSMKCLKGFLKLFVGNKIQCLWTHLSKCSLKILKSEYLMFFLSNACASTFFLYFRLSQIVYARGSKIQFLKFHHLSKHVCLLKWWIVWFEPDRWLVFLTRKSKEKFQKFLMQQNLKKVFLNSLKASHLPPWLD